MTTPKRWQASPEYRVWKNILTRCTNPRRHNAHCYALRGIAVCARWRDSFEAFLEDVGPRPSARHSIDRIDNDRGYEPGNVRWVTPAEQSRNTRRNKRLTLNGRTMCAADWAKELRISPFTLYDRIRKGWSDERVLTAPCRYSRGFRATQPEVMS